LGSLGKTAIASREKILIDLEFYRIARRFYEGINTDERHKAFESISSAGKKGTFLTDELTLGLLREGEHYAPALLNREVWDKQAENIYQRAREEADNILHGYKNRVSSRLASTIEDFFNSKRKELIA
jgi:trimethylamine:corrinoid methyltransferase-like protein